MTQKNNILAVVASICSAITLSACVVKKKDDDTSPSGYSEQYCRGLKKAYDSANKVCTAPDLAFCATKLTMVKGTSACRAPASQNDCTALGGALNKSLQWINDKCEEATSTAGQGKLDSTIRIAWSGKRTVQGAQQVYVDIGSATITPSKNEYHQVSMLKKKGSTCELRRTSASGKSFKVQAKGPASTCEGMILVINTKTGDYNVKEFSVTIN